MANTARAATTTSTTGEYAFRCSKDSGSDGPPAQELSIGCDSASSVSLLVNVEGIHGSSEWCTLAAGESLTFFSVNGNAAGLRSVRVKVASGTGTYTLNVTSK